MKKLSDDEIRRAYGLIRKYYDAHLSQHGVRMPRLERSGGFSKDALVLVYLAQGYPRTRKVSKEELTEFIRGFYPTVNDVQQARHLGEQKGWFIAAGGRNNRDVDLRRGEYQLITLERPYPAFHGHRVETTTDWDALKTRYGHRCVTYGSPEGQPNFHYPNTITTLQRSHKDPAKPLVASNVIPQCQKCNRADRNNWVYNETGRVIKVANPLVIKRSPRQVRLAAYKILYEEFDGRPPLQC